MAARFTDTQGQYLAFLQAYTKLHRRPPAEADIQAYFDVTPPTVHRMIVVLTERGLIRRRPGAPVRLEFPILSLNPGSRQRCVAPGVWPTTTEVRSHASLKGHTPLTFAGGHMVARAELNNVR